ncbi:glyoxylate reductase [Salsuginibacillus halophilus]|uniref:Glyoxylate/hydroxypyruvate reductase B n=1 Tax=Salsuginibacillus halophilus TaxID=517424 RepID=A0A2P8HXA7_9BACI|nr:D-glycerate dehydrogenase [Salsuginibacillus halophilus]PSL50883.1 glyoxylate reductase [Salsuginibacillus halophilus]
MSHKIVVTRSLPEDLLAPLHEQARLVVWPYEETPMPYRDLKQELQDADALFCNVTDTIDQELIESAPKLKVIATMAVGYNNIDIPVCQKHGIKVAHTPDVLTETTADLTFTLLLSSARRVTEGEALIKNNQWQTWAPFFHTGVDIYEQRLGIIGMGRIGEAVARRAQGFSMDICYYNRSRNETAEQELGAAYLSFQEVLSSSDFVCVQTPLTPETKYLLDRKALFTMKEGSVLINTSRGGVIDEQALYEALVDGPVGAAGLDVFEDEPISSDHPLLQLPQVTATPHIGSATVATRRKMAAMTVRHIQQVLAGGSPEYAVV